MSWSLLLEPFSSRGIGSFILHKLSRSYFPPFFPFIFDVHGRFWGILHLRYSENGLSTLPTSSAAGFSLGSPSRELYFIVSSVAASVFTSVVPEYISKLNLAYEVIDLLYLTQSPVYEPLYLELVNFSC